MKIFRLIIVNAIVLFTVRSIAQQPVSDPVKLSEQKREFVINSKYLNIPIQNGATKRKVTVIVGETIAVKLDIELATTKTDWWAPMDVSAWKGKKVVLQVDKLPDNSSVLNNIEPSDEIKAVKNLYHETLRPQLHFSPMRGWNNDPNGLVFYNGEYHMFFQHNPFGWDWGNMHWGHATSRDLVHWKEHGDVLLPDELGAMFSGSAVVDRNNMSGFGKDGKKPLVLTYTAAGDLTTQCIAYSNDGRTFTKYNGNPVLKQITGGNRDPKVFWYEPTKKWVLVLYVGLKGKENEKDENGKSKTRHASYFFNSENLRDWKLTSITEGGITPNDNYLYECPDFFELPFGNKKLWVLSAANTEYTLGSFNGEKYTPEVSKMKGNLGRGFYAAQTFSNEPSGRIIQIGWLQAPTPGMPFNQSMSLPHELKLRNTKDGPKLVYIPVKELESLRKTSFLKKVFTINAGEKNPLEMAKGEILELRADFIPGNNTETNFSLRGVDISYDAAKQELLVDNMKVPAPLVDGHQKLIIYADRTSLEIFASDGLVYVPMPIILKAENRTINVSVKGGSVKFNKLEFYELNSIWK